MHIIKHIILLVSLLVSSLANADTTARQQLERFLDNTQSFSASFKQKLESEYGELLQQSAGKLSMQRPENFAGIILNPIHRILFLMAKKYGCTTLSLSR